MLHREVADKGSDVQPLSLPLDQLDHHAFRSADEGQA